MTERRHDIDWLRNIAIVLVLYFHSGLAFIAEGTDIFRMKKEASLSWK